MEVVGAIDLVVRTVAFAGVVFAGAVAATYWAARSGRLGAKNPWFRGIRSTSDGLLRPIEHRLVRRGGNPQDATLWLLGLAVAGGLLLITLTRWLIGLGYGLAQLANAPPSIWLRVALDWTFGLLMLALVVRVFSPWFGLTRYNRWVRPAYQLTDWLIEPIRRLIPPGGRFDWSPLVAYLLLYVGRSLLATALR
jgi:uncharacterized protein YggT (Ycf19 family)